MKSFEDQFYDMFGPPVKRIGSDIRYRCPQCGDHNNLSCSPNTGMYHCWTCNYSGTLKKGIPSTNYKSSINTVKQLEILGEIISISDLSVAHKKTLREKRGIYNPEKYFLKTVPFQIMHRLASKFSRQDFIDAGLYNNVTNKIHASLEAGRLIIPYLDCNNLQGIKVRVNEYEEMFSSKYIVPPGMKIGNMLWHPDHLEEDVILTEGELAAISGCEHGISTCGLPSMTSHGESLNKFKRLIRKDQCKRVFIIIDTDRELYTRIGNIKAALTLNRSMPKKSCICFLPNDENVKSVDLDYYLEHYGTNKLFYLMEEAWINRTENKKKWEIQYDLLVEKKNALQRELATKSIKQ